MARKLSNEDNCRCDIETCEFKCVYIQTPEDSQALDTSHIDVKPHQQKRCNLEDPICGTEPQRVAEMNV